MFQLTNKELLQYRDKTRPVTELGALLHKLTFGGDLSRWRPRIARLCLADNGANRRRHYSSIKCPG
ncbi:hypothetical protein J6590_101918 [Homalodisca vitripennis]|nr:hypothetical protein J6590_101918 [Homalodisca vitripennis]